MCMLCVIPPNVIPSREKLENSALNNPHGFGFAIVIPSQNRIHAERTMNADESINKFLEMRKRHPEGYAMWHARYATHGSQSVENCHPFRVNGDRKTYLAHNGILPVLEDDSDRSDTRIFAEDVIPAMGGIKALDNPQIWNILEDFTTGSKVCILTVDPVAQNQMYLLHEEKGKVDEDGVWWSNDSCYLDYGWGSKYKYKTPTTDTAKQLAIASSYVVKDSHDWLECGVCEAYISRDEAKSHGYSEDYCEACGSCYGCSAYISDCLCYKTNKAGNTTWAYNGVEGWQGQWQW